MRIYLVPAVTLMFLLLLARPALARPDGNMTVLREAEDYDRYDTSTLFPLRVVQHLAASQGSFVIVRSPVTGEPKWVEYDYDVDGGCYELWITLGGNNTKQAALISIDGGDPVLVMDETGREDRFREYPVGSVILSPGLHSVRVEHASISGISNSLCIDSLRVTRVERSSLREFRVGHSCVVTAKPGGTREIGSVEPLELILSLAQRYYGPGETIRAGIMLRNKQNRKLTGLRILAKLTPIDLEGTKYSPVDEPLPDIAQGAMITRLLMFNLNSLAPGRYTLTVSITNGSEQVANETKEVIVQQSSVPAWAKRASIQWHAYQVGRDVAEGLWSMWEAFKKGANTVINSDVADFFGEEAISYPLRGQFDTFMKMVDFCHENNGFYLMYHSMVTVHEHFYHFRKELWEGYRPYYHCSWLSIDPRSGKWQQWQANDFEDFLSRYPLDGIFLDNASAVDDLKSPDAEDRITDHLKGLRAAIKRANPIGILYVNYNSYDVHRLSRFSEGWDVHMSEGPHPVFSKDGSSTNGKPLAQFMGAWGKMREITGKPVWPLMYAPDEYSKLCVAACAASRLNPAGTLDPIYVAFMDRLAEYIFADNVFPAPQQLVDITPHTEDIVATAYVKIHPSGVRDWIIHIVNATMDGWLPISREVRLTLNLPDEDLKRQAFLLCPENDAPKGIPLSNSIKLNVGTWTVLVISEKLEPDISVTSVPLTPVIGEQFNLDVAIKNWNDTSLKGRLYLSLPEGWESQSKEIEVAPYAAKDFTIPIDISPAITCANTELWVNVEFEGRVKSIPLVARPKQPLDVRMYPDHFSIPNEGYGGTTELTLTNNSSVEQKGRLELLVPEGWSAQISDEGAFKLSPGETLTLDVSLKWPAVELRDLYDIRDFPVSITMDGTKVRTVKVRLHMPIVWVYYCTLGTRPADVVRTGATPGGGFLSDAVFTVRGYPNHIDKLADAVDLAIERQSAGEQRVVLWLRTADQETSQLDNPEIWKKLEEFIGLGGGLLLQENIFKSSPKNRGFFSCDICPITGPFESIDEPGGDWIATLPEHPCLRQYFQGKEGMAPQFNIPPSAQPRRIRFCIKPWAEAIAANAQGDPVIVVSKDPARRVAYIAGSLEGEYINQRSGVGEYPGQMPHMLVFYAEIMRWLAMPSR